MLVSGRFSWKMLEILLNHPKNMEVLGGYAPRLQDYAADPNPVLMELNKMKKVLDHLIGLDSNPTTISNKNWDPRHSADICICAYHMYIPHDMNNSPVFFFCW